VVFRYSKLPSTNDEATRLVRQLRPPEYSIIIAEEQTAGRGQHRNAWLSEPGANLTCSFILYPRYNKPERAFLLNMAIALATADCIRMLCEGLPALQPAIKWPNDILCSDLKVAGILLENIWQGQRWDACVAGVGINVRQQYFSGIEGAASLDSLSQHSFEPDVVLSALSQAVKVRYRQWERMPEEIHTAYNADLWRRGLVSDFQTEEGAVVRLQLESVDLNGAACILDAYGRRGCYPYGKIRQLR